MRTEVGAPLWNRKLCCCLGHTHPRSVKVAYTVWKSFLPVCRMPETP